MSDDPKDLKADKASKEAVYGDDPILSEAEMTKIRAEVKAKVLADQKKDAATRFRDAEERRLRYEEGLTIGGVEDDMVTITMDMAEHSDKILINMRAYWHGRTYTVPRHLARTLGEVMHRGWMHQNEIDGKSRQQFYQNHRPATVSAVKGVSGGPRRSMA